MLEAEKTNVQISLGSENGVIPGQEYRANESKSTKKRTCYLFVKRFIDVVASACGLIILSPIILGTAVAVKLTSPGPAVFKQTRVGINKTHFQMYKFRTMRVDTPSEMPSHLIDATQWLTPIGAFLRKTSLDELPQMWNILKGDMTIVGPRPALWNQFDLVAERDKYGANGVKPGITGWAQINGRDELNIETKAWRDGEYIQKQSLAFDAMCFFKTIGKVLKCAGVVEERSAENPESETPDSETTDSAESDEIKGNAPNER